MSEYLATITWRRSESEDFLQSRYSRAHQWAFDGGAIVPASASPHVVPAPYSVEQNVDPEEAFVASLSSCHMLFFLSIAARRRLVVDEYIDNAVGVMEKGERGKISITRVILRPAIKFAGDKQPTDQQIEKMHQQAHEQCFIANSVTAEVVTEMPG